MTMPRSRTETPAVLTARIPAFRRRRSRRPSTRRDLPARPGTATQIGAVSRAPFRWRGGTILQHHIADCRDRPPGCDEIIIAVGPFHLQVFAEDAHLLPD